MVSASNNYSLEPYLEPDIRTRDKKFIPTDEDFSKLREGDSVMVRFSNNQHQVEQLVVRITSVGTDNLSFTGTIIGKPEVLSSPQEGEEVTFGARNISGIFPKD